MWPNKLAAIIFILCRKFLTSLTAGKVLSWFVSPSGPRPTHCWGLNTLRPLGLFWKIIIPSQRILHDNTHQSQETDNPAPIGIQTRNTSKRGAEDPRLRPRYHRNRRLYVILQIHRFCAKNAGFKDKVWCICAFHGLCDLEARRSVIIKRTIISLFRSEHTFFRHISSTSI